MARHLVVAHQTSTSPELITKLREIVERDQAAEFVLLVPATPVSQLLMWEEGESIAIAHHRAEESRRRLEQAGLPVLDAKVGDYLPLDAIMDELRQTKGEPAYASVILSTFPPGMSRWLRMDLPTQLRRKFPGLRVEHVLARPEARETVEEPVNGRYLADMLP
jgi:hypothetical protein